MNITLKNIDPVNAIVKLEIVKEDYSGEVDKMLKDIRKNASIPGFRKGMVPTGYIKKMYEKSAIVEQVNKLVSGKLFEYIRENNINILGEPLPNETEQKEIDFENNDSFEFCFDLGLAPTIDIELTAKDKLPYYTILVSEELIEKQIENFRANYGTYETVDELEGKDMAKGLLTELDENGSVKEGGIQLESSVLMPNYMKSEEEKAKLMGAKINSVIIFNPYKAYEGAASEIASLLKISKENISQYENVNFSYQIEEITRYKEAELGQDLFDKVFGENTVTTEAGFKEKIKEMIVAQTMPDSDYKFLLDARELLKEKADNIIFPETFLKRWLLTSNEKRTAQSIEEDYPKIIEDLKFHLIKEEIAKKNGFKVEENDLKEAAKKSIKAQFAQYGMATVPENILEDYAKDMLKKEETVRNLVDKILEDKLVSWLKENVKLTSKEVTIDEFHKLFQS